MIAPRMIGDTALVARLAAIPVALRAALAGEADHLGRRLRDRLARPAGGEPVSLAVDSTEDGVTLTVAMRRGMGRPGRAAQRQRATRLNASRALAAPLHPRSHRFQRAADAPAEPPGLDAAFVAMRPEIRARLETAFRRVLVR